MNPPRGRLVHTGQVIIDLVMPVDELPSPGGDVLARDARLWAGGGFNVMSAAARSGARVVYAGAHGTGRFGDQAREALREEGITVAQPPLDGVDTGVCVVLVDDSGERTFVTGTGAEGMLSPERLVEIVTTPEDLVYVSGYSLMHEANRAALLAWLPGVRGTVLFDPGPLAGRIDDAALTTVLARTDLLSCNAAEARTLSGNNDLAAAATALMRRIGAVSAEKGAEPEELSAAAASVSGNPSIVKGTEAQKEAVLAESSAVRPRNETSPRRIGPAVVVRDGAAGCVLARDGRIEAIQGFPVDPVDTNGAGDAHCGVLAAALLAGADLTTAAERANAAASLAVRLSGPATAPTAAQIDRFLAGR
ncbi:PfkB family carbohydrate kinase [Nocardia alni]|uniref:PfkB family carbohydrate kinase n=1 Tax=Nocardia alni TaxID=2815723 RepID=UPI001C235D20|nr:PfkB family carbohydrate kinase [Nocardia alni]